MRVLAGAGRPCSCKLTVRSSSTVTAKRTATPAPFSWIACCTLSLATSSLVSARVMTTSFEAMRVARSFHPVVIMLRLRSTSFGQVCMRQLQSAAAWKLSKSARANLASRIRLPLKPIRKWSSIHPLGRAWTSNSMFRAPAARGAAELNSSPGNTSHSSGGNSIFSSLLLYKI
jgi:hypothetical protein